VADWSRCGEWHSMEHKMEYMESSHFYSTKFMRNSKAIGVLWGIFTVCYAIITIVAFVQVKISY
jgi:hypothetical protein